jgi:hypothetical protein
MDTKGEGQVCMRVDICVVGRGEMGRERNRGTHMSVVQEVL